MAAVFAGTAAAASGGNSANAKLCQMGGWQSLYTSNFGTFSNEGQCTSYAAHGGTLSSAPNQAALDCQSLGGTYGNNDLIGVPAPVIFTCDGYPYTSDYTAWMNQYNTLKADCATLGYTGADARGNPVSGVTNFTCSNWTST
jgi:hypothetical protein